MDQKQKVEAARFGVISLALVVLGWIGIGVFKYTGFDHTYFASWWVKTVSFCCYIFSPLAALFGIGGLVFDRRKTMAMIGLALSLAGAVLVFYLRP